MDMRLVFLVIAVVGAVLAERAIKRLEHRVKSLENRLSRLDGLNAYEPE